MTKGVEHEAVRANPGPDQGGLPRLAHTDRTARIIAPLPPRNSRPPHCLLRRVLLSGGGAARS